MFEHIPPLDRALNILTSLIAMNEEVLLIPFPLKSKDKPLDRVGGEVRYKTYHYQHYYYYYYY